MENEPRLTRIQIAEQLLQFLLQALLRFVRTQNETNHRYRFCCSLLTSQIRIRVGEYDFSSVQERLPYVERGVAKKVVHPKYNFFTYEYDLALVRLESSLTFAPHISPICLPATDDLLIGENATVTGWGRLSEGGTLPSVLQEVNLKMFFGVLSISLLYFCLHFGFSVYLYWNLSVFHFWYLFFFVYFLVYFLFSLLYFA